MTVAASEGGLLPYCVVTLSDRSLQFALDFVAPTFRLTTLPSWSMSSMVGSVMMPSSNARDGSPSRRVQMLAPLGSVLLEKGGHLLLGAV